MPQNFDEVINEEIPAVVAHLRAEHGATSFGCVGFCWGGRVAAGLSVASGSGGFAAVGGIHAAMVTEELLAPGLQCPLMLLQCGNDPPLQPLVDLLDGTPLAPHNILRTYHDQLHGFCAGRGDWTDPTVAAAAKAVTLTTVEFFKTHLGDNAARL
jgi:dienelactone hydrolase